MKSKTCILLKFVIKLDRRYPKQCNNILTISTLNAVLSRVIISLLRLYKEIMSCLISSINCIFIIKWCDKLTGGLPPKDSANFSVVSVYPLPFIVTYENNKNLTRQSLILNCRQKYKKPFEFVSISRNKFSGGRLLLIFFKINSISLISYSRRFIFVW